MRLILSGVDCCVLVSELGGGIHVNCPGDGITVLSIDASCICPVGAHDGAYASLPPMLPDGVVVGPDLTDYIKADLCSGLRDDAVESSKLYDTTADVTANYTSRELV